MPEYDAGNLRSLGGRKPVPAEARFLFSFKYSDSGCWEWQGRSRSGSQRAYGRLKVDGKTIAAHRFSWEMHNGKKIPDGMLVMHSCDNPICVNPDHLSLGTHQDNMRDCVQKGRQAKGDSFRNRKPARGESNGLAKITSDQALCIFYDQRKNWEIAKDYAITSSSVSSIKRKRTWRHIHD